MLIGLWAVASAGFAYDMRVWEDVEGNQVTGRFYSELFGKVTVINQDGEKMVLGIDKLSDEDKKYIRVMVPPKIKVEVRTQTKLLKPRPMALWRDDVEKVYTVVATVTKQSQRPFTSRIKAELFMVADEVEGENQVLLQRVEGDFLLLEEKNYQYEFRSPPVKTIVFTNITDDKKKGEIYKGYLLILSSMQGDLILIDSNLPKWMQQPDVIKNLRELSIRGASSMCSRHFDKTGKKVPPPRPTSCPARTT